MKTTHITDNFLEIPYMQVKRFLILTILLSLLLPSFAQAQQERPIVRLIYFTPRDRKPQPDIDAKMDKLIKDVQKFYAENMKHRGLGKKTFLFETDRHGNAVVHHVKGKHKDAHYHNESVIVWEEIYTKFDKSKNFYLTALDISTELLDSGEDGEGVCGKGSDSSSYSGHALIPASGHCFNFTTAAHELGHGFGLSHNFSKDTYLMSYGSFRDTLSQCSAEWCDVHPAFNAKQDPINEWATIEMPPPRFESMPNAIRLRFKVTAPGELHQAQLITPTVYRESALGQPELIDCKRLNTKSGTVEFVTTLLATKSEYVRLHVIDKHGNVTLSQQFPINISSLLPRAKSVSIPDRNLEAAVGERIGNSITTHTLLNLGDLDVPNSGIRSLKGLEHAHNLRHLNLSGEYIEAEQQVVNSNRISDFSPLAGLKQLTSLTLTDLGITDVSPLENLTQLDTLRLSNNAITDVSPLENLTQLSSLSLYYNAIVDISPLENLTQLTWLGLDGNAIFDISALTGMTRLDFLSLANTSITDISALENLTQLTWLNLGSNTISDVSPLENLTRLTWLGLGSNTISDVSPLEKMTQLRELYLSNNTVSDISVLSGLTQLTSLNLSSNTISDVSPLLKLDLQGTEWDSTGLYIQHNPLSYTSINKHIPAMQKKGVEVEFDPRTPTTLTKRLGDAQQGKPGKALSTPLVVEVRDEKGIPFAGVPIKFTVTAGDGKIRPAKVVSNITGRAQTTLTLGDDLTSNTVRVTAAKIKRPVIFTATATDNPPPTFRKPTTFSVAENTTDIGTVEAIDANKQDKVTGYTISPTAGEDSAKFSITPTGTLRFKTPPDYERPTTASRNNEYIVLVSATSGTGKRTRTGTHSFIITVTDVDEPPDAPATPTVIPATRTSLIVSWVAPENTGPRLTYEVRYREGNTGKFINANYKGRETNFTLNGLKKGKKYQVRVRAKNDEGTSAWSPSGNGIPKISPPIDFPSTALRVKIAEALEKKRKASITPVDMLALTQLDTPNANIQNLTGLEHAHNLRKLNLRAEYIEGKGSVNSNTISDFSPIAGLTNLTSLDLSRCSVSDVSFLTGLTQLTFLHLGNNDITDITPLEGLTQLRHLDLSSTSISDVSPLAGLTQLTGLYLYSTSITDISALSSLTQLTGLGISSTSISDISALSELTQLRYLYLGWNGISDISPLAGLTQLTQLQLSGNGISDVSALAALTQMEVLYLQDNEILDVSPLVGLDLSGTQWDSTGLYIERNPLSYTSINTHIPAMQAKGIEVKFNNRIPTTLVKISGDTQQSIVNESLPLPFLVEVRDERNRAFSGVPVTFTVASGDGRLSAKADTTDVMGRAETRLTLGRAGGRTTVRVTAVGVSQPVQFTATAILLSSPVSIPDTNLQVKISETLNKSRGTTLTVKDMLTLTTLTANNANIHNLMGLQHASNLKTLALENNNISDVAPLAGLSQLTSLSLNSNNISDVASLRALPRLKNLSLDNNNLSYTSDLAQMMQLRNLSLDNNNISDVTPLESLTQLQTLHLRGNPLNYPSLHTHIPAIQASGAVVRVTPRTPTTFVKVSGTHGVAGISLPVIAEVQDEQGLGFSGVPVTFTVTAGGGRLSTSNAITDVTGRARTNLTLGAKPGKNTVRAAAVGVRQPALFSITAINANTPVTIPDRNLRAKIAESIGKQMNVPLTAGDMLELTKLEAPNADIRDLTGLEQAHNLSELNLSGEYIDREGWVNSNTISDFSPLVRLTQLTRLNLSYCTLSDVSFLSGLTQLTSLRLFSNPISDISPLTGLTQLTFLELTDTAISDVSPLIGLTELSGLYLFNTSISDLSALSSLTQLTGLGVSSGTISDVSPLAALTQLTYLSLGWNAISDISPLAGLTQLTSLDLPGNTITDVSPLSGLTQLKVLHLYNNRIIDVSPLVELNLTGTQWNSTGLYIERNPLNYASIHTHIPAMQAKGVEIKFDNRAHSAFLKISGDTQQGKGGTRLPSPFIVEAIDPHGTPMTGLIVRFHVNEGEGDLSVTTDITDANGRAQTTLTLGPNPGMNRVYVSATQITYPVYFTAIATEAARLAGDVNGDGIVNVQDLVLVSSNFGQTGQNSADVNSDGVVNISDLVLVAGAFSSGAAAPALHPSLLAMLTTADVQKWLDEAKHLGRTDATYLRGIVMLEQLLLTMIPKETALLANYPNPFNPETWIPYQLEEPTKVILHVYAVNGELVRTLELGHQPAGMYLTRSRAAYWDGRNSLGETVASGIYFYTLTAGNFTATRKMLIRK